MKKPPAGYQNIFDITLDIPDVITKTVDIILKESTCQSENATRKIFRGPETIVQQWFQDFCYFSKWIDTCRFEADFATFPAV